MSKGCDSSFPPLAFSLGTDRVYNFRRLDHFLQYLSQELLRYGAEA
jgi:hypothetical protein